MVWSRRDTVRRRQEARHRWDALLTMPPDTEEGLLDLYPDTAPAPIVAPELPSEVARLVRVDEAPSLEAGLHRDLDQGVDDGSGPGSETDAHGGNLAPSLTRRSNGSPRLAVSPRLAAVVAVVLTATCGAWWWLAESSRPDVRPVSSAAEARAAGGGAPPSSPPPTDLAAGRASGDGPTVHVVGAVAAPGVYHLADGARVHEAVAAAGGALPSADTDRLNLAATVQDGTRLRVPARGDPEVLDPSGGSGGVGPASGGGSVGASAPASDAASPPARTSPKVNINTATVVELAALPRVGPVLAQRIADFRSAHGRFSAPEDLDAVSGIGPKMLESLLPLVTVQ